MFSLQYLLNLSFMEAAKGANKDMTVRTSVICDRCNGKRAEPGSTHSKCSSCNGTGEVSPLVLKPLHQFWQDIITLLLHLTLLFKQLCTYLNNYVPGIPQTDYEAMSQVMVHDGFSKMQLVR